MDYAKYGNENFCTLLLFRSEENEILYAEAAGVADDGMKTGEVVLRCRKY